MTDTTPLDPAALEVATTAVHYAEQAVLAWALRWNDDQTPANAGALSDAITLLAEAYRVQLDRAGLGHVPVTGAPVGTVIL